MLALQGACNTDHAAGAGQWGMRPRPRSTHRLGGSIKGLVMQFSPWLDQLAVVNDVFGVADTAFTVFLWILAFAFVLWLASLSSGRRDP